MAKLLETQHPVKAFGWAARDPSGVFSPIKFSRRATGEHDVQLKILYCGVCYSEVHLAKNEWGSTIYPLIPGHEFTGVVTEVGSKVKKFKPGDKVAVGTLVGSCRECDQCIQGETSYCLKQIFTINDRYCDGTVTYGGFSNIMVADEHFVFRWPENFPLDKGAPLLCAGITTYSPLRHHGLDKPGVNVGVVGLGGLGHLAVKFAKALGCRVTVISTSSSKKKEAIEKFGVDEFLVSQDQEQMKAAQATLDGIIDTVSASHDLRPLLALLKPHCKLILVGLPTKLEVPVFPLVLGGKSIVGSASGGVKQVQEMIDFAAKHNILPEVEIISMDYVNTAIERLQRNDVKYRFVIDVGNTLKVE